MMKRTSQIAVLLFLMNGLSAQYLPNRTPASNGGEEVASTRKLAPEEWNGKVGEDGKIPEFGHIIEREEDSIQVIVWNNRIRAYFLDEEDLVMEPPVDLITIRANFPAKEGEFIRLTPRGNYLEGNLFLRPPFTFAAALTVHYNEEDREKEIHSFSFYQDYIKN